MISDEPWLQPLLEETSVLDPALMHASAADVLRETTLLAAPTHQAKGVASRMAEQHGVQAKTIHAAFLAPVYPAEVTAAMREFSDAFGDVADATEARKAHAASTLAAKIKAHPDALVRAYLENGRRMTLALADLGVNVLALASHWAPRASAEVPLLAVIDETSMISPRNVDDIAQLCDAAVFLGDGCQLPPVAKSHEDQRNGVAAAAETEGAVAHRFVKNFRLSAAAPDVEEILQELRAVIELDKNDVGQIQTRVQRVISATRDRGNDGGGFVAKSSLDLDDIENIALGRGLWITGTNNVRAAANHRFRTGMLGASVVELLVGERCTAAVAPRGGKNDLAARFVQKSTKVIYAGRPKANGGNPRDLVSAFAASDTHVFAHAHDPASRLATRFWFDYPQVEFWKNSGIPRLGDFSTASLELKFAHCQTAHSVQGSQAPAVYIRRQCVTDWLGIKRKYGSHTPGLALQEFAQWLYTAISRSQSRLIMFDTLPAETALSAAEKAAIRQAMRATVE